MGALPIWSVAVVDDEPSVRKALARLLRSAGFQATEFASGHDFVRALGRGGYPCVIIDLQMPGMSGADVLAHELVRGTGVAVIIITAHDDAGSRTGCLTAGAAAYLCKPFDDLALLGAVKEACLASLGPRDLRT